MLRRLPIGAPVSARQDVYIASNLAIREKVAGLLHKVTERRFVMALQPWEFGYAAVCEMSHVVVAAIGRLTGAPAWH